MNDDLSRQMIHMKCQVLFSLKKNMNLSSAVNLLGALRLNFFLSTFIAFFLVEVKQYAI